MMLKLTSFGFLGKPCHAKWGATRNTATRFFIARKVGYTRQRHQVSAGSNVSTGMLGKHLHSQRAGERRISGFTTPMCTMVLDIAADPTCRRWRRCYFSVISSGTAGP